MCVRAVGVGGNYGPHDLLLHHQVGLSACVLTPIGTDTSRLLSLCVRRGKRLSGIAIRDHDITDIAVMHIKRMQISTALLVALSSGEVSEPYTSVVIRKGLMCACIV